MTKMERATMEINGVTIQMLPAASGDCIYLEFPDSDFRMLIDGASCIIKNVDVEN